MAATAKPEVDLSKVVFNPSKSFTFQPLPRKQQAMLEITNNTKSYVWAKFKNTNPTIFSTIPKMQQLEPGQKQSFRCMFKGLPKEKCGKKDRFTVVLIATSKNVRPEALKDKSHLAVTKKHLIHVIYPGVNDEKEVQQPTANDDDEDKDRQGRMRNKSKSEAAPAGKKAMLFMFLRKEGESLSDEDDGQVSEGGPPPGDDMQTTRPAGQFTGQTASNETPGAPVGTDELRTTRPAGQFNGQVASNVTPGAAVDPKSAGMLTTRPAGAFTQQAGQVAVAPAATPADPKSAGLQTTRDAGKFNAQVTPNAAAGGSSETPDLKTTKKAGDYENPPQKNK